MNSPAPRRNPIVRFFVGLWDVMNFTRRLVLNLLFFGLLLLILLVLAAREGQAPLLDRTTLVIAPEGKVVEQYSTDPVTRSLSKTLGDGRGQEIRLRDLLRAIDAAAEDKRIERVLLRVDKLQPSGLATLREVSAALRRLREAGKQIVAFGEGFDQSQYLLAAQADEVYIDPMGGGVILKGFGGYHPYFGEALRDKLEVDVHVFKVGDYKSAVEPYVMDEASEEAKEADRYWMNDLWQRHLADLAEARSLTVPQLAASIDRLPEELERVHGDIAAYAVEQKLVDGLMTQEEVENLLAERGAADADAEGGFRQVSLDGYLAHLDVAHLPVDPRPQVAVVVAEGTIVEGEQPAGAIGGVSTSALLREARDDEDVKAVVLRVNSPGGSAYASEQISREVEALKEAGKPVVVSMGPVAASGGYWISMNADRILADPSTITGSIGVFSLMPRIPRTLEKLGIHTDGVRTTRFADGEDITRPLEPEVGRIVQAQVEWIYSDFVAKVAAGRDSQPGRIEEVARGRVWSGAQALERGLVDELGGLEAALHDAAVLAELEEDKYRVRYIEQGPSTLAQWLSGFASTRMGTRLLEDAGLARRLVAGAAPALEARLRFFEETLRSAPGSRAKPVAYCFCEL